MPLFIDSLFQFSYFSKINFFYLIPAFFLMFFRFVLLSLPLYKFINKKLRFFFIFLLKLLYIYCKIILILRVFLSCVLET